jgi:hypothetical protein
VNTATFLVILVVSLHDGQAPVIHQIRQTDMASCRAQIQPVVEELRVHGCDKTPVGCSLPYVVHATCVTGVP